MVFKIKKEFYRSSIGRIIFPPGIVMRQLSSVVLFSHLLGWKKFPLWLFRHSIKSLPVAAGAIGMGCIGFPNHPVFEITGRCNLKCIHCHASPATVKDNIDELDTSQVKELIDGLSRIPEFRVLVFTGGEPFVREDLIEILEYSKYKGFSNVIATNATLITDEIAKKIKKSGVFAAAVSLDSTLKEVHNRIRQDRNAFEMAMNGIEAIKKAGILLQINTTAMEYNFENLKDLIKLADDLGSGIMLMYQLVPVGRGCAIKDAALDINSNEKLLKHIYNVQKDVSVIVETVAGPQYWPFLIENKNGFGSKFYLKIARNLFHGCTAGRGLVYIKPNGDVWPCPFVEINAGNILDKPVDVIWKDSSIFKDLRNRSALLKGKCGECKYNDICGGCRGRAYALTGDLMSEDKYCFIQK
jgi:AdoMet-dependent heme synthase